MLRSEVVWREGDTQTEKEREREKGTPRGNRAADKSTRVVSSIKFSFLFLIPLEQSISRGLKINLKSKTQPKALTEKWREKGEKTLKNNLPDLMREAPTSSSPQHGN